VQHATDPNTAATLSSSIPSTLDEPTTALDVIRGRFIVAAICRERGAGRAVLF
jgi:ABC-type Na+ transport system ATPase subunit NatA